MPGRHESLPEEGIRAQRDDEQAEHQRRNVGGSERPSFRALGWGIHDGRTIGPGAGVCETSASGMDAPRPPGSGPEGPRAKEGP